MASRRKDTNFKTLGLSADKAIDQGIQVGHDLLEKLQREILNEITYEKSRPHPGENFEDALELAFSIVQGLFSGPLDKLVLFSRGGIPVFDWLGNLRTEVKLRCWGQKKKRQWGLYIKLKKTAKTRSPQKNREYIRIPHK